MADYSTEELEKIADKFRSDTSGIRGTKDFTSPEELYDELKKEIKKYHPSDDTSLVDKAYRVAYDAHKGQARKSGEPYIIHPLCVAIILAELELDKETIAAGLLHDVLEDTIMTMDEMRAEFGDDVAHLVDGVTKLKHLHLTDSTKDPKDKNADRLEMQAENLRKMFLAMAKDIRVILIKLADRLHNMRTLKYQSKEAQQRIARETQEYLLPYRTATWYQQDKDRARGPLYEVPLSGCLLRSGREGSPQKDRARHLHPGPGKRCQEVCFRCRYQGRDIRQGKAFLQYI